MPARLTAGLLHKAPRGEWALPLPTGLARQSQGTGHKRPNQDAHARLSLGVATFVPCRSASTVVAGGNTHALWLPRRDRCGALVWKAPRGAARLARRKPPASAGALPSGRPRTLRREANQGRPARTRRPQAQGRLCIPDRSPPSSSGDTALQRPAMRTDQHAAEDRHNTRGIPRPGTALGHGLVSCGACGHTMVVQEKGGTRSLCHALRHPERPPVGQDMAADPVATRGGEAVLQARSPVERAV
jgi:hypothetical protein